MEEHKRIFGIVISAAIAMMMVAVSVIVTAPSASAALTPAWVTELPMGNARCDAVIAQDGVGLIYVAGGFDVERGAPPVCDKLNSYDPMTGDWQSYAPMLRGVAFAAGAVDGAGLVYVISGYNYSSGLSSEVQIFDPAAGTWSYGTAIPSAVLYADAAVGGDGKIYVVGGWLFPGSVSNLVQIYDPELDSWSAGSSMPGTRMDGVLVERGGYMYYIGGLASIGANSVDTALIYGYYSDAWYSPMTSLPEGIAHAQGVVGPDGVMYVLGGGPTSMTMDFPKSGGYYYDFAEVAWAPLPNMNVGGSFGGAGVAEDGRILVLAGHNDTVELDRVESLQVMTERISLSATSVGPGGKILVTAAYDFAFLVPISYDVTVYLLSSTGVVYEPDSISSPLPGAFAFEVNVPALAAPGDYTLVLMDLYVRAEGVSWNIGTREYAVTVVDIVTVEEQIAALQTDIDALQSALGLSDANVTALRTQVTSLQTQLTALQTLTNASDTSQSAALADLQEQITALQDQLDKVKTTSDSGNMWGMVNMILVIIVIVLLALMFVMGRKGKTPAPPAT